MYECFDTVMEKKRNKIRKIKFLCLTGFYKVQEQHSKVRGRKPW